MIRIFSILILFFTLVSDSGIAAPSKNVCTTFLNDLFKFRNRDAVFHERVVAPLEDVAQVLKDAKSPEAAALSLAQHDFRKEIFKVEALSRFYKDEKWAKKFTAYHTKIKALEDFIGSAVDTAKLPLKVEKLKLKLPAKTLEFMKKDADQKMADLSALLVKDGWFGKESNTIEELLVDLKAMKVPGQSDISDYVKKRLQLEAKLIREGKLDMHDLQGGLHELRRKLRWLLIDIHAHRGQIQIIKEAKFPKSLEPYTHISDEAKKFLDFPKTELMIKGPVQMKESSYVALSYFVEKFGDIKDQGELHERILHALLGSKAYASEAEANAWLIPYLKKQTAWQEHYPEAQKTYEGLMKSGLLDAIP